MTGLFRIGKDAEVRTTGSGDQVTTISLAYNYGRKDASTGKYPTQWIDAALWGDRGSKFQSWLVRGASVFASIEDLHTEEYRKGDGSMGYGLKGRIGTIVPAGPRQDNGGESQGQAPRQQQAARPPASAPRQQAQAPRPATGFEDMDDDIPF